MEKLTANNLKNTLWDTLLQVKDGKMDCGPADTIAAQAREILRTTKVQLQISAAAKRDIPIDVLAFNEQGTAA